jgi:hypothetical protein
MADEGTVGEPTCFWATLFVAKVAAKFHVIKMP